MLLNTLKEKGSVVLSPYATLWAEGNYYILGREEKSEELTHFRIDYMKDIVILERGVDMIFGGINPGQYARKYISRKGEPEEKCEVVSPKRFRDEIQTAVMEAYRKYWE